VVEQRVGSLLEDRRTEAVPLLEDQTSAADHHSTAFVKDLPQQVDQELHECLAVMVADLLEEWPMNCRVEADVQDRQASELVAADPMPAMVAEMLKNCDLKLVQAG